MALQKEGAVKSDREVRLMRRERAKGRTQEQAAARAGMGVRTARAACRRSHDSRRAWRIGRAER